MSIVYTCRHCAKKIGELDSESVNFSMLGIDELSTEEKHQIIQYENNGDLQINVICDSCHKILDKHPEYHELDFFIQ